jgi:hypothetical protein
MEYGKIISVTGMPGLYELLSSKNDGAIVRSLDDKTTKFVSSRVHNFSHLESIEIYTVRDNVNLVDVFQAMENSSEKIPDGKDAAQLKKYFESVYPDIDFERVYTSDLKKMAKWLQVLKANNVEIKLTEAPVSEESAEDKEPVDEQAADSTGSKTKKSTTKAETADTETPEKAPAKKSAAKDTKEAAAKPTAPKTSSTKQTSREVSAKSAADEEETPKKKAAPKAKKESESTAPAKKKAAPKKKS